MIIAVILEFIILFFWIGLCSQIIVDNQKELDAKLDEILRRLK